MPNSDPVPTSSTAHPHTSRFIKPALILTTGSLGVVLTIAWSMHQDNAQREQELLTHIEQLKQENAHIESRYQEQVDSNHLLAQSLTERSNQLQVLSKRIVDVESVLGLTDEDWPIDDSNLEQRIDAAAIDSAVRATLFRLIPNDSPVVYQRISSSYGSRINPISGKRKFHTGIDLTCKNGEEILAPADGVIETVRPSKKGFGNFLTLRHSFGFMSSYAHLDKFKARSGEFVRKGDVIATCGNSGNSTGPHLHYEVRFLGRSLNPMYLMDWTPENFDYVFEKEKKVKWAPLVEIVDEMVRLQVNLTNNPYRDESLATATDLTSMPDNETHSEPPQGRSDGEITRQTQ